MKKTLFLSLAAGMIVASGSAYAADLSRQAPRMVAPAPVSNWTGLYIGANGGWGWSNFDVSEAPFGTTAIADISPQSLGTSNRGAVFGGQLGYNWQIATWLLGIEGDYDGTSINSSQATVFPSLLGGAGTTHTNGLSVSEDIKSLASLRGRIGYTWADGLLYFTGGGAWESISTSAMISANTAAAVFGQSATGSVTNTRSGYVIGGGVEWMVARNWTVRGEYLYYNFSGADTFALPIANCAIPGCGVNVTTASNNINVFRLGANYKFDWFR
jgi:outer membrane immunogenic protein